MHHTACCIQYLQVFITLSTSHHELLAENKLISQLFSQVNFRSVTAFLGHITQGTHCIAGYIKQLQGFISSVNKALISLSQSLAYSSLCLIRNICSFNYHVVQLRK